MLGERHQRATRQRQGEGLEELAVERVEAVADLELDRRGIGRGDRGDADRDRHAERAVNGDQPGGEADPQGDGDEAVKQGSARWPIISTIAEAGPTIASTARAPTRMKSKGKAPRASGR